MSESYWATKPLKVISCDEEIASETTYTDRITPVRPQGKQILSNDKLLESITTDFNKSITFLNYTMYWTDDDLSRCKMNRIVRFINNNYITSNDLVYKLHYSTDLIKFYYDDPNAFIMEFSFHSNPTLVIGYVIGKKETLIINDGEPIEVLEANFLCLIPKFRRRGLTAYILNILTVETVLAFGICIAHYTISPSIKSPHYCQKKIFHRPINIPLLVKTKFFNSGTDVNLYKFFYNTFEYVTTSSGIKIELVSGDSDKQLIKYLYTKYIEYCNRVRRVHYTGEGL